MSDFQPKQTYKNPAEAFRLFIAPQNLPVKQAKFYQDVDRLKMKNADKSINLATLLAYVRDELKVDAATGISLVDQDLAKQKETLDIEERRLKIDKLKREGRKDDRNYIARNTVNEREGALVGAILNEVLYRLGKSAPAVITACKGDPAREREVKRQQKNAIYDAFRTIYESGEIDATFEEEEEN